MPANLPPQYYEAEKIYRQAKTIPEKIEALENMLAIMPKHKGTDHLKADLRARIAKLMDEAQQARGAGRRGPSYYVRKEGAGQVALVGLPNSGKSQLLASLTEAEPRVADYPFTTQEPLPGMAPFENIQIQVVDMPAINDRAARPWLRSVLRSADVLLIVVDLSDNVSAQVQAIFEEMASLRVEPIGREARPSTDDFWMQKRVIVVGNKLDEDGAAEACRELRQKYGEFPVVCISAVFEEGLDELKRQMFEALDIIRVYTKAPGQEADLSEPVVMGKGSTIEDVAETIHKDIRRRLKYAQVWGSGKFSGQRVHRQYTPEDGDIIELHT